MTTNTPGSQARQDPRNVSNTIRWRFTFADPNLAVGVQIGVLPANAFIITQLMEIVTAFNAGTTNPISVGTVAAAYNNIHAATDNTPGTPNVYAPVLAANKFGRGLTQGGDTPVFLKYTPTGTAPTTGVGEFLLEFEGGFPDH
jgi:hypothetical protein